MADFSNRVTSSAKSSLNLIEVASPCKASWERMAGDDQVRFCAECSRHVYNLSGMTRNEADAPVRELEGKLCVRFFRRADGTLLTNDCPIGVRALRALHARGALLTAALVSVLTAVFSLLTIRIVESARTDGGIRVGNPVRWLRDWLFPPPPECVMGEIPPRAPVVAPPPAGDPPQAVEQ